jgi:heme-degrading monooxygenase HmoA
MYARMSKFAGLPPERVDRTLQQFEQEELPALEQQPGFEGILVLVDRGGGTAAAISLWDTQEHLRASEEVADRAREKAMETAQLRPRRDPVVDRYEVVMRK